MVSKKNFLPYGDTLRDYLNSSVVTSSMLRTMVRKRGVFFAEEDKSSYIPYLVKTGITPNELDSLIEDVKDKEENPKRITQVIKCSNSTSTLISVVPQVYKVADIASKPFSNYRILGVPSFKIVGNDPNVIEMDFSIERHNYTQSWDKNTAIFSGRVRFKRNLSDLDINISLSHTSAETKEVANKIVSDFTARLKESGLIEKKDKVIKIKFDDFTNENRMSFLRKLSQMQSSNALNFNDTKDVGFCPDNTTTLPTEIEWMQEKISNLVLQGKDLHSTFFLRNKSLHKHIQVYRVEASYTFDLDEVSGTCAVSFDFPDFIIKQDRQSELIINVDSLRITQKRAELSVTKIKEYLLTHLEQSKIALHKELANPNVFS